MILRRTSCLPHQETHVLREDLRRGFLTDAWFLGGEGNVKGQCLEFEYLGGGPLDGFRG